MPVRVILQRAGLLTLVGAAWQVPVARAQSDVLVEIRNLTPREHRTAAFVLPSAQAVRVDAVGAEPRRERKFEDRWWWGGQEEERDTWPAAAWIRNATTREVVWDLRAARTDRSRNGLRRFSGTVQLPAGVYVAHYGSFPATSVSYHGDFDLGSLRRGSQSRRDARYGGPYVDDGSYREFALAIRGAGRPAGARDLDSAGRAFTASTVIALRPDGPAASLRTAFAIARPTDIEVTAIGEMRRNGVFDYGWIQTADTRRRVWGMTYSRSVEAGGAHKNRMAREIVHLAAGRYIAYFVTDDSHDPDEWNAVPAFDPDLWGLTLRVADPAARAAVRPFEWEPVPAGQTIVSLTDIGDDKLRSAGFTLRRSMDVRIYALGEGSNPGGEMDDYAWILDATSRRRVWAMRYEDTEHAGGAEKNRLFDGTIRLEAGRYVVYYKSDGSHGSGKWNDAPPAESRYWGVSIFPASGQLDRSAVGPREDVTSDAVAELVRIRSGRRLHTPFTLDSATLVRVVAIGEGSDGEMFDYGWIENAETGTAAWEMTYRATTHAGGARKNRLFDGTIRLPAGRYELRYETDGSHAYGDWNDDPPDDPAGWGIAVLRAP
ncbi:MAG: hypothetical protein ACREMF_01640 [Gemmatimonadales bacterium]